MSVQPVLYTRGGRVLHFDAFSRYGLCTPIRLVTAMNHITREELSNASIRLQFCYQQSNKLFNLDQFHIRMLIAFHHLSRPICEVCGRNDAPPPQVIICDKCCLHYWCSQDCFKRGKDQHIAVCNDTFAPFEKTNCYQIPESYFSFH